jgi:hypothetical protein
MIIIEKYIERIYKIIGRKHVYGFGSNKNKIVILVGLEFEIDNTIKKIDEIEIEYKVI